MRGKLISKLRGYFLKLSLNQFGIKSGLQAFFGGPGLQIIQLRTPTQLISKRMESPPKVPFLATTYKSSRCSFNDLEHINITIIVSS